MELTGQISKISMNYISNRHELTLSIFEGEKLITGYEELKDTELLDVRIIKHRKKRSLDANAYFHVLVGKLADKLSISKPSCKNILLGRYGQSMELENGEAAIIKTNIPVAQMLESETVHCMPCGSKPENGRELTYYKIIRGSSTYDTAEMSRLIDGAVYEWREQGIETLTPEELSRIISQWKA